MSRTFARDLVFGTLKDFGISPQSVTKKTKLSTIVEPEIRIEFVKQLNEKLPLGRVVDVSHGYMTVGQLVTMAQNRFSLPGGDDARVGGGRILYGGYDTAVMEMGGPILPGGDDPTEGWPKKKKKPSGG